MAHHHNDESTDDTTTVPWFDEVDPPDEDEFNQTTAGSLVSYGWRLRIIAYKHKTLKFREFAKIDWEKKINLQQFLAYCSEPEVCHLRKWKGKMVPIPCPKHRKGTNLMWRQNKLAAEKAKKQRFLEWFWKKDQAEQKEKEDAETFRDRFRSRNPDLWRSDKLWQPLRPGVAIIRGDMLPDVATFFRNCNITVEIHNEPTDTRRLKAKGEDIVAHPERKEIRPFTRAFVQVRVSIDKFNQPPTEMNLEHPDDGVLRGLNGAHGNAMCGLIIFLGSTGEPASDKIDKECTYWFYCDWGFSGPDLSKIGENPFRMVRLSNEVHLGIHEMMNRFDLRPGKKRAKSFIGDFNRIVKPWRVTPSPWQEFHRWGDLRNVDPDSSAEDDLGEDDSSEDDSSEDDSSGDENPQQANAQEENTEANSPQEDNVREEDLKEQSQAQPSNEKACQKTQRAQDQEVNDISPEGEAQAGTQPDTGEATDQNSSENDEAPHGSSIASRTRGACRRRQPANKRRLADEEPQVNPKKKARAQTLLQLAIVNDRRRRENELSRDQDELIQAQLQAEMNQAEVRDDIYSAPEQEQRMETQNPPEQDDIYSAPEHEGRTETQAPPELEDIYSAPEDEVRMETQAPPALVSEAGQEAQTHEVIIISSDESSDESSDGFSDDSSDEAGPHEVILPVTGTKSAIPEHLRGGAKDRWGAP